MSSIRSCYQCKERYLGCHSSCERYLDEKKKLHEIYEAKKNEKNIVDGTFGYLRRKK